MPLSTEKLAEAGLRSPNPPDVPDELKNYSGWVAKCKFRLTDQEVVIIDYDDLREGKNDAGDDGVYTFRQWNEIELSGCCDLEYGPRLAYWLYEREQGAYYSNVPNDPPIKWKAIYGLDTLERDDLAPGNGFIGVNGRAVLYMKKAHVLDFHDDDDSYANLDMRLGGGTVLRGHPDDLDEIIRDWKKLYTYHNHIREPYEATEYAIHLHDDPNSCPQGWEDEVETFFGMQCTQQRENQSLDSKKMITIRARVADLELGKCSVRGQNPWSVPPGGRYREEWIMLDAPKDPDLEWEHKDWIQPPAAKGTKTAYNTVGIKGSEQQDQRLYLSTDNVLGEKAPNPNIYARLHSVQFFHLGCSNDEIKCMDKNGNVCCLNCCKVGGFVLEIVGQSIPLD